MNRDEAIDHLITTQVTWPASVDRAPDLPEESRWWWYQRAVGDRAVVLANDDFDCITREEWSNARREALNRPEEWPRAAEVLVQTGEGIWIFGTFGDAEPHDDGWEGQGLGTWLNEGAVKGRADVAGWDWRCSLTRREDIEIEALESCLPDDGEEVKVACDRAGLPPGYAAVKLVDIGGYWRAYCKDPHDFAATYATATPEEEEAMRAIEARMDTDAPLGDLEAVEHDLWQILEEGPDPASHYQRFIRIAIGDEDRDRGYVEVKLDPYRLADALGLGGGPREQVFKKTVRGTTKGQSELEVVREIRSAIDRWEEMLIENERITYL